MALSDAPVVACLAEAWETVMGEPPVFTGGS